MVLGQSSRANDITPRSGLALVDVDDRDDTSCATLDGDGGSLVELEGKDVFVVGKSNDELEDKNAATSDDSTTSAPVGVLPVDAFILFVQADGILGDFSAAIWVGKDSMEVLGFC